MSVRKVMRWVGGGLALAFVAIQAIPVERTNPPVESELAATPAVHAILKRACYDCHSNETTWPWYSRVAPASWLVARDVREGREHLNFSTWGAMSEKDRQGALEEMGEEVSEGAMPPWFYVPLHSHARLSSAARDSIRAWSAELRP